MSDDIERVNVELARLRGFIDGKLPLLATRHDVENIINCSLDRHVAQLHYNKKNKNSIPPVPTDRKILFALITIITILSTILSKVFDFVFSNHP